MFSEYQYITHDGTVRTVICATVRRTVRFAWYLWPCSYFWLSGQVIGMGIGSCNKGIDAGYPLKFAYRFGVPCFTVVMKTIRLGSMGPFYTYTSGFLHHWNGNAILKNRNFRHLLPFWQFSVQSMMEISSKWHFPLQWLALRPLYNSSIARSEVTLKNMGDWDFVPHYNIPQRHANHAHDICKYCMLLIKKLPVFLSEHRKGKAGHFKVNFHDLLNESHYSGHMMKDGWTLFELHDIGVRLKQETIVLKAETRHVAENVALALCSCILFVLCEPRFDPPGIPNKTSKVKPVGHDIPFFAAMGHSVTTPSNSYLFWIYYENRGNRRSSHGSNDNDNHDEDDDGLNYSDDVWEQHFEDSDALCPWDPDRSVTDVIRCIDAEVDVGGGTFDSATSGCGGCASSCGGSGGGGSSCASSCGSSSGGGGSSCGSSCGGGGSSCGSSCGGD